MPPITYTLDPVTLLGGGGVGGVGVAGGLVTGGVVPPIRAGLELQPPTTSSAQKQNVQVQKYWIRRIFFMPSLGDSERYSACVFATERVGNSKPNSFLAWLPPVHAAVKAICHCMVCRCHSIARYQFGAMCAIP